jgi:hypothetical protein
MHASPETTQLIQATPSYPDTASAHSSIATSTTATPELPQGSDLQSRSSAFDSSKQPANVPITTATPPLSLERVNSTRTTGIHRDSSFDRSSGFSGRTIEERQANHAPGLRSAVVEDTLSDIEEAISEISKNREHRGSSAIQDRVRNNSACMPPITAGRLSAHLEANDDSSEYSVQEPPPDIFLSESENEGNGLAMERYDDFPYTRAEVMAWSPAEVAEYLKSRHIPSTTYVKFEEQEVSGSILLELEMSHLKELELGSFGKRFQVWKEIEHLTKRVKHASARHRNGSDAVRHSTVSFLEDASHNRPPSGTVGSTGGPVLPHISGQHNIPPSRRYRINVEEANAHQPGSDLLTPLTSTTISSSIASPTFSLFEQPRSPPISPGFDRQFTNSYKRYSTHEHTSTALNVAMSAGAAVLIAGTPDSNRSHQRESSFDKNWSNRSIDGPPRPATATGMRESDVTHKVNPSTSTAESSFTGDSGFSGSQAHSPEQFAAAERSYFSGGESISRERKVLHKKNGRGGFSDHCATEGTLKSGAAHLRHSRIASTGSDARKTSTTLSVTLPSFLGGKDKHKRKSASFSGNLDGSLSDYDVSKTTSDRSSEGFMARPLSPAILVASAFAGRSISTTMKSSFEESLSSPGATGSISTTDGSTPSSMTINMDGGAVPSKPAKADRRKVRGIGSGSLRSKSSARKGLRNVSAAYATEGADYSGWMKKRGSSGIGGWKPRFFVLSGRRLAYFYSNQDTKERGLVDITSHKVLPASDDRLIELHAAFAAVTSPITSPCPGSSSPGPDSPSSPKAVRGDKEKEKEKEKEQGWFTFKLVPPAPGTAKGVTFTPPRLHYFATNTRDEGKKWMAALMKATIDRDETSPIVTSYSAKTISLAQARALRIRPPHLAPTESEQDTSGLAISGIEMGTADGEEADIEYDRNGTPRIGSERGSGSYEASHNTDDDGSTIHDEEQVDSPSAAISPQTPKMDQHNNSPDASSKQDIKQPVGEGILQLQAIGIVS